MLSIVLSLFLAGAAAPWLLRRGGQNAALLLAGIPLAALLALLLLRPEDGAWLQAHHWWPSLGVSAAFHLDGLSLLMATLILGIGGLVFAYASRYLAGDPQQGRFYAMVFAFAGAMLGVVLADDLFTLFVFWELTSVTSYLLIGYQHEREAARAAALQGLVVTAAGGLAMLAGFLLLTQISGHSRISGLAAQAELIRGHQHYPLALGLIAAGCFAKSAQFPLHFWLPNAMAAPTPVSAYLHSATMVKAGVYLLARLHPVLGGTELWFWLLAPVGAATLTVGALQAYRNSGFKAVLASTTLMALGTLVLLLGLGQPAAAVSYLLAHALYKGALFLLAGIIDHETGARDLHEVSGQRRALPVSFAASLAAALSLAALPPSLGFIAKELALEHSLHVPLAGLWVALVLLSAVLATAMAAQLALRPFVGALRAPRARVHEAPWPMLAGPVLLALGGLFAGLFPAWPQRLLRPAAEAAGAEPGSLELALWHGLNLPLALTALSLLLALPAAALWPRLQRRLAALRWPEQLGPEAQYTRLMRGLDWTALRVTTALQNGRLPVYLRITVLAVLLLCGGTLLDRALPLLAPPGAWAGTWAEVGSGGLFPLLVAGLVLAVTLTAVRMAGALTVVVSLSSAGFGVALLFFWYSALDVAITQLLVETLTTILLALVLFRLPRLRRLSSTRIRLADALLSGLLGVLIVALLWMVLGGREHPSIASWFIANSVPLGQGRNIVNVILVDFRAFDTLGEIFVLALAAFGVVAMLSRKRPAAEGTP